jgi:hypothetical protein
MIFIIVGMCVPLHARVPTSPNHHSNQDRTNNEPKERQEDLLKDII